MSFKQAFFDRYGLNGGNLTNSRAVPILHTVNTSFSCILNNDSVNNILKTMRNAFVIRFNSKADCFYAEELKKLAQRYEKCLKVNGGYVEK